MASRTWTLDRVLSWGAAATEEDWAALYAEMLPRIHDFFRYRVGAAEAEDLTAITFEKAWRARHRYRRDLGSFSTWTYAIARNVAIDHHRRQRRHLPLEAALEVAALDTAEAAAMRRSDADRLARLLEGHDERARELLALKYGAGLSHREIGRLVGLTESHVGTLVHRAVTALRAAWNEGEV